MFTFYDLFWPFISTLQLLTNQFLYTKFFQLRFDFHNVYFIDKTLQLFSVNLIFLLQMLYLFILTLLNICVRFRKTYFYTLQVLVFIGVILTHNTI